MQIPYLSADDLDALNLTPLDAIGAVERVIRGADAGTVWAAPKAVITPPDGRYMMTAMAAMGGAEDTGGDAGAGAGGPSGDPALLAIKTVVLNAANSDRGLAQINGLVTLLDSQTGLPAGILDGPWITGVRTAALSATAARRMANPASTSIGFVGCGLQARTHLEAFGALFDLTHMRYFGRGQANQDRLVAQATAMGLTSAPATTAQEVADNVDLLVTSVTHTSVTAPFLDATTLKPGSFAAIVDLGAPWHRDSFAALDRVVIDDLAQEASMPAKLCDPQIVTGDLSGLVLDRFVGRADPSERTAFLFRGHALGDLALSVLAMERHAARS